MLQEEGLADSDLIPGKYEGNSLWRRAHSQSLVYFLPAGDKHIQTDIHMQEASSCGSVQ